MALPPTMPTSFVPHAPANAERRYKFDFIGVFGILAYIIFFIMIGLAAGVFFYEQILTTSLEGKNQELAGTQKKIDSNRAEQIVKLYNRLNSATTLLGGHVALTRYYRTLGGVIPSSVRFTSMRLSTSEDGTVRVDGSGVAKNFNALASASKSFAAEGKVRDAIFSHITVNKDNSVAFSLSAAVDPTLIAFVADEAAPLPVAPAPTTGTTTP